MNPIQDLTAKESAKQRDTLNLIASENYPSPRTLALLGSLWSNKYAEGLPGKRYYAGNVYADELESYVQSLALRAYDPTGEYGVNVQVLSGSPANATVYLASLEAGDTIMSLDLAAGGHLSHIHETSAYRRFFKQVNYGVKRIANNGLEIDEDDYVTKLIAERPKLVILGFSAYPQRFNFGRLTKLAHQHGALVLADVSHINGLIAAGLHDSPFKAGSEGADFISMTTHKTMRGPRGAMLFAKHEQMDRINRTVFPGTSGGPHLHQIAAVGQSLLEILGEDSYPDQRSFKGYGQAVLDTCKALETALSEAGLKIVSPTQNHLCLVRLPKDADSLAVQERLERAGILVNRNALPFETKTAWKPSGLRLGTAALTSRGLTVEQAAQLGRLVGALILGKSDEKVTLRMSQEMAQELAWYYTI